MKAVEGTFIVDSLGKGKHLGREATSVESDGTEGIAEDAAKDSALH